MNVKKQLPKLMIKIVNDNRQVTAMAQRALFILFILTLAIPAYAQEYESVVELNGKWLFTIGDKMEWASKDFNDTDWDKIEVDSPWEDQGYHGYNGYAWYRYHFQVPAWLKGRNLYLHLGYIDDVDEVYLNGKLVGFSGTFPPQFQSTYYADRKYPVPAEVIKWNAENVIAVRVYDQELSGGMLRGELCIAYDPKEMIPDYSLAGVWKFKTGDDKQYASAQSFDKTWRDIIVPGFWENQGYPDYNGIAWYKKTFFAPAAMKNEKWVIVFGGIDDFDEVYVNGVKVGSTGVIQNGDETFGRDEYRQFRGYWLPDGLLKPNAENSIAVRVYDGFQDGGIYKGPAGFITQKKYVQYWKNYN